MVDFVGGENSIRFCFGNSPSGSTEPSYVLRAMGCADPIVSGSLRISLGATTTPDEVAAACERIVQIAKDLRRKKD